MPETQYIAKTIVSARDAIATHIRWKITLVTAARIGERLSERAARSIQEPGQCAIYQWLLSTHTLPLRRTPEYRTAINCHAAFHREMQAVARLLDRGDFATAARLIDCSGSFESASTALANALMALERIPASSLAVEHRAFEAVGRR